MIKCFLLSLLVLCGWHALAQAPDTATSLRKTKPYLATLRHMEGGKMKGWLYRATDDSILLLTAKRQRVFMGSEYARPDMQNAAYGEAIPGIKSLTLRKKKAPENGLLIGMGVGALTGAISGFASGDDEPGMFSMTAEEKALGGALGGALIGGAIGGIIGTLAKTSFEIGGNRQQYLAQREAIRKKALAR